eukprot:TRINITY_DN4654_c0_g2_i1.p1 TRINITY_DN4654_c0_g2~~TRINITY_DN4654_c0_g2_i1.p1  ORF type:complete len:117 (-),score=18.09 TRINITY_DN4654_c0_g2_i1:118-468(-)
MESANFVKLEQHLPWIQQVVFLVIIQQEGILVLLAQNMLAFGLVQHESDCLQLSSEGKAMAIGVACGLVALVGLSIIIFCGIRKFKCGSAEDKTAQISIPWPRGMLVSREGKVNHN